ncbi:MAG: hypothetical protein R2863_05565 [Candidatus Kapaibacterium sp.]|nr:hypothetical protein [Ignavibacteriota bacterium]
MRKLIYILLISSLLPFIGCENALGPQYSDTKVKKTETKWRVSTVNDNKISKVSFKTFNSNGDILSKIEYKQNGIIESTSDFSYNNNIRTEFEVRYSNGDTAGILMHQYEIKDGKVISKITTNKNGDILDNEQLIYDRNGNVTEIVRCDNSNGCDDRTKYGNQYVNGNLAVRYTYENDGSVAQKDSIVYSTNENYFEKFTSDKNGNLFFSTGYKIDKDGKIIEETLKNSSGTIIDKFIYEYTYFD